MPTKRKKPATPKKKAAPGARPKTAERDKTRVRSGKSKSGGTKRNVIPTGQMGKPKAAGGKKVTPAVRKNPEVIRQLPRTSKDSQQLAAELAVINSVLSGLAARKDMQGIYELVGAKLQGIFDAQIVMIVTWDQQSDLAQFRYIIERGKRLLLESRPPDGLRRYILQTGNTVMINEDLPRREEEMVGPTTGVLVGEEIKSRLEVPMLVGKEVVGVISLQNIDREHAFSESDLNLLQTLANSMSVALENARLFDETQRLLKETEQRAARSWRSSAVFSRAWLPSLISRPSWIWLATSCERCSTPATWESAGTTARPTFSITFTNMSNGERLKISPALASEESMFGRMLKTRQHVVFNSQMPAEANSAMGIPSSPAQKTT